MDKEFNISKMHKDFRVILSLINFTGMGNSTNQIKLYLEYGDKMSWSKLYKSNKKVAIIYRIQEEKINDMQIYYFIIYKSILYQNQLSSLDLFVFSH